MKPITWDSTREEVLAAVEEHERRDEEIRKRIAELEWPERRPGQTCVWSTDSTAVACGHDGLPSAKARILEAQARAGEEDQSVPGWDSLP